MRASPAINHSQERHRSNDPQPWLHIRAKLLPARGRVIKIDPLIEKVIRPFHQVRLDGANRLSAQVLPAQQCLQFLADRPFHLRRLSCSASSDGFKTIGKAFADGQNLFAGGSKND